jgi:hypothetical protein
MFYYKLNRNRNRHLDIIKLQSFEANAQYVETNAQSVKTNAQYVETNAQSFKTNLYTLL